MHKTVAALEDPELQSINDQFPELSPELERISERAKRELDEVDDAKHSLKLSFDFFEKELENLRNRLT